MEVFGENLEGASAYPTYSSLRNMLLSIVSPSVVIKCVLIILVSTFITCLLSLNG